MARHPHRPADPELERPTEQAGPGSPLQVRRFRLVVKEGPDAGKELTSTGKCLTVGTHASADLVLADPSVSRFHCEIALEDGQPILRDLKSRNGTFVNGVPVREAPLLDGALLALGRSRLRFKLGKKTNALEASDRTRFGSLVGRSPEMRSAFARLERAATGDVAVLLLGETGTGKEMAAEAIHAESRRRRGPFVVLDCGAIPPHLAASELFGHLRGAFTGAVESRPGALQRASGGTLFLDEIGELPLELQPHLLRALDRHEVKPLGAATYTPVDVRVVAATHRDLRGEVNAGRFRADLFYRLSVLPIRLPSLSERLEDLPLLVEALVGSLGAGEAQALPLRDPTFLDHLAGHAWPGNVRELRNYLERCLVLRRLDPPTLDRARQPVIDTSRPLRVAREAWVGLFEQRYLQKLLDEHGGNVRAAAQAAGLDRAHFYRVLWKHGLR